MNLELNPNSFSMKKISIIHLYLYGMLKRKAGGCAMIKIGDMSPIIKWCIRLPKRYQVEIIKELVDIGLLDKVGRDNYNIRDSLRKAPIDSLGEPLW